MMCLKKPRGQDGEISGPLETRVPRSKRTKETGKKDLGRPLKSKSTRKKKLEPLLGKKIPVNTCGRVGAAGQRKKKPQPYNDWPVKARSTTANRPKDFTQRNHVRERHQTLNAKRKTRRMENHPGGMQRKPAIATGGFARPLQYGKQRSIPAARKRKPPLRLDLIKREARLKEKTQHISSYSSRPRAEKTWL